MKCDCVYSIFLGVILEFPGEDSWEFEYDEYERDDDDLLHAIMVAKRGGVFVRVSENGINITLPKHYEVLIQDHLERKNTPITLEIERDDEFMYIDASIDYEIVGSCYMYNRNDVLALESFLSMVYNDVEGVKK